MLRTARKAFSGEEKNLMLRFPLQSSVENMASSKSKPNFDGFLFFPVKLIFSNALNGKIFEVSITLCMANQGRISGPLLDRIDMQIQVGAVAHEDLQKQADGEPSARIAARVAQAHARQLQRQDKANHLLSTTELDALCQPDSAGEQLLRTAMTRLDWSARAYHRVLKVARTIADLAGAERIGQPHVAEAIQYRRALREQ
jgi:predicted ATPase with chaperone activity